MARPRTLAPAPPRADLRPLMEAARSAQAGWARLALRRRAALAGEVRHLVAERADRLSVAVSLPQRASAAETLSAEVLPLAEACAFLEREAPRLLATRKLKRRGRPMWLMGSSVELRREPWGVVLILGPANYPLLLPGVQALQALVAGNAVLLKPGRGGEAAARELAALLEDAGLPAGLLTILEESIDAAAAALEARPDKVLLTGSADTGRQVLERLAPSLTPAVMELSGCDAVFVREDADLDLVTAALRFGLDLNGGATCIAPRRVFVARSLAAELNDRLRRVATSIDPAPVEPDTARRIDQLARQALARGARIWSGTLPVRSPMAPLVLGDCTAEMLLLRADVAAPVLSIVAVDDDEQALAAAAACDFELGATVFGSPRAAAALAERIRAGVVVLNDMIVPTADPRVPFGGRGASGFGVTRGADGLLELTRVKAVIRRRGRFRPHFDPVGPREERVLRGFLLAAHARTLRQRLRGWLDLISNIVTPSRRDGQ